MMTLKRDVAACLTASSKVSWSREFNKNTKRIVSAVDMMTAVMRESPYAGASLWQALHKRLHNTKPPFSGMCTYQTGPEQKYILGTRPDLRNRIGIKDRTGLGRFSLPILRTRKSWNFCWNTRYERRHKGKAMMTHVLIDILHLTLDRSIN